MILLLAAISSFLLLCASTLIVRLTGLPETWTLLATVLLFVLVVAGAAGAIRHRDPF